MRQRVATALAAARRARSTASSTPAQSDRTDEIDQPSDQAPGSSGRHRRAVTRRRVEARLVGLPLDGTPDWWAPCWERGAEGGLPSDVLFDVLAGYRPDVRVLHHLAVDGTATTIDHVLVGSGGVVVAGTETCEGRVRTDGVQLRVRGRDRSFVVDVALWRAEVIRATLERRGLGDVPVQGALHWEQVESLGDRPHCLRGIPLLSAGGTLALAATGNALSPLQVERVAASLARETHRAALRC